MSRAASAWNASTRQQELPQGRLFISGLSPLITHEQINEFFDGFGQHFGATMVASYHLDRPSQVAVITLRSTADAARAMESLNGTIVNDLPILVAWVNGQRRQYVQQAAQITPQQLQQAHHSHGPTLSTSSPLLPSYASGGTLSVGEGAEHEVFVGDLPVEMSETGLARIFDTFVGSTHARIMRDTRSGKSRGYGFICFSSIDDAQRAIAIMNGEEIGGKTIRVGNATSRSAVASSPATPASGIIHPRSRGLPPTAGAHSGPPQSYETVRLSAHSDCTTMYRGDRPVSVTEDKLAKLVAAFGSVLQIRVQRTQPPGSAPKTFAFVKLDTHDGCTKAIQAVGGKFIDGQRIKSGWAKDKEHVGNQVTEQRPDSSSNVHAADFNQPSYQPMRRTQPTAPPHLCQPSPPPLYHVAPPAQHYRAHIQQYHGPLHHLAHLYNPAAANSAAPVPLLQATAASWLLRPSHLPAPAPIAQAAGVSSHHVNPLPACAIGTVDMATGPQHQQLHPRQEPGSTFSERSDELKTECGEKPSGGRM